MAFNGRFVLNLIRFAGERGVDRKQLLNISGHSEIDLSREDYSIESDEYNRVLEKSVDLSGDQYFGLHMGESMNLAAAGLIAQITQTCSTVKEALDYCCEFAQLGCSSLPMNLEKLGDEYKLTMTPNHLWLEQSNTAVRHTVEGTLVFTIREYHTLTNHKFYPNRVELPFKKPSDSAEYERLLQCPVSFEKNGIAIYFNLHQIESPVVTSDYKLLRILVDHARDKLSEIENRSGIGDKVKQSIINLVRPQFPTIDQVANHLNISVRTLQRKLSEENLTYKGIIESLRKDFAVGYLKNYDLSIKEIAYLLNYNDASSFIRSFRRVTGKTPLEYRKQNFH